MTEQIEDDFWAQERARAVAERGRQADPSACGTCRTAVAAGGQVEHDECAQRAILLQAPDHPDWELVTWMTEEEVWALPARFHVPVFLDTCTPKAWVCAVCWGDGWNTQWPCKAAQDHGTKVFTPEHQAETAAKRQTAEMERLRKDRDAFRDQRNAVFQTNQRLIGEVQASDQARLHAENEVRQLTRANLDAAERAQKEIKQLRAQLDEMTRLRDNALRALHRDDVETDIDLEETIAAPFYGPGWDWDENDLQRVVRETAATVRPAFGKLTQERDQARTELAKYVGAEPTIAEEMAYLSACIHAVHGMQPPTALDDPSIAHEYRTGYTDALIAVRAALEAPERTSYPPALPWARLMDDEDLSDFLDELMHATTQFGHTKALAEVEDTCARWRAIAEAQHAHNTAPGPGAAAEAGEVR
ncbi:hypothetical protein [Streptomyces sp. NPDC004008]